MAMYFAFEAPLDSRSLVRFFNLRFLSLAGTGVFPDHACAIMAIMFYTCSLVYGLLRSLVLGRLLQRPRASLQLVLTWIRFALQCLFLNV